MNKPIYIGHGKAFNEDCFEVMKEMPNGCVDMIFADLPYGTTACKWDTVIPFEKLWPEFNRICKPNAAMVFTASQPFTSALVMSNVKMFSYGLIWSKSKPTGHLTANKKPMNKHEDILVFSRKLPTYNPQGTTPIVFKTIARTNKGGVYGKEAGQPSVQKFTGYPNSILDFKSQNGERFHPTQKPVALLEYLIETYTNENELVFDPTAGSLTTGVAAENLNRRWVVCEQLEEYFTKGIARFSKSETSKELQEML